MTEGASEDFFRGYDLAREETKEYFEERGISIGIKKEQERIQALLNMHIQWALEANNRTEATILSRVKKDIATFFTAEDFDDLDEKASS